MHSESRSPSVRPPCLRRPNLPSSRNFLVFPVQLGQTKSSVEAFPFTTYPTFDLKARYSFDPTMSQEIDDIWIDSASYYKQKQSPQHEFIIFSVTTYNGMRNYISLDRNIYFQGSSSFIGRNKMGPPAQDRFHVSHYGDVESLASRYGEGKPKNRSMHLEQVDFESRAFSFAQLVVLASTVGEWEPCYKLNSNDRWFANLVWESIFRVFNDGIIRHNRYSTIRGRFKGFKSGDHGYLEKVVQKYKVDLVEFEKGLGEEPDAISVDSWCDRKDPVITSTRVGVEQVQATDTPVPPEQSRPPPKQELRISNSLSVPRPRSTGKDRASKTERTSAPSTCASSNWTVASTSIGSLLSTRTNKELPGLPSGSIYSHLPRPRAKSVQGIKRIHRTIMTGSSDNIAMVPDTHVTHGSLNTGSLHETPLPSQAPRVFSWVELDHNSHIGYRRAKNNIHQLGMAYMPLPSSNQTRIARGHLKPRERTL
ncbi:unnamed protein product [Rhizoctonia solani]|uniref:Uncharacterized protein n=1 Tax=Rhizoctonia solani TaxID=456999 RepID=A0A8H3GL14_9AGAM|nr:unnamed protein product [Rhizoctonia solani]